MGLGVIELHEDGDGQYTEDTHAKGSHAGS